jgi:methionine synthase II (cobalamin-independent)
VNRRRCAFASLPAVTSTAPASLEVYRENEHYKTDDEYVFALAEALRVEYEAIANAGLIRLVDILLRVKAQAYLIEAANVRHEHEYVVWDDVKLPEGKILIPGVITHSTQLIEHPELVSQRIQQFAKRVGRENVIAGADCGFGGRSHPQITWAKLRALTEGAALTTQALGYR